MGHGSSPGPTAPTTLLSSKLPACISHTKAPTGVKPLLLPSPVRRVKGP